MDDGTKIRPEAAAHRRAGRSRGVKGRLTVGELARRVLPNATEEELAPVVRQLRHWTVSRVLPNFGPDEIMIGSGRHRGYFEESVPFVAVAVELGRWRLSMETLFCALIALNPLRDEPLWQQAIDGQKDILLVMHLYRSRQMDIPIIIPQLTHKSELSKISDPPDGMYLTTMIISLSKLFARLR